MKLTHYPTSFIAYLYNDPIANHIFYVLESPTLNHECLASPMSIKGL